MNNAIANPYAIPAPRHFLDWLFGLSQKNSQRFAVVTGTRRAVHEIAKCETVAISQPHGVMIECLEGSVWLTLDHDPRDVVLDAGQSFQVDSKQRLLVHGLDDARVRILG